MICRELTDCKMPGNLGSPHRQGGNFILRRALPFATKSPSKEWLNITSSTSNDYDNNVTTEERSHEPEVENTTMPVISSGARRNDKDVAHKTVIYFGDSNQRQNNKFSSRETSSQLTSKDERTMIDVKKEEANETQKDREEGRSGGKIERQRSTVSLMENEDAKVTHEIVVNVSPSREDVLRIEEDESQVEDYWSLPGDSSGFKADWGFVQQWRLRG